METSSNQIIINFNPTYKQDKAWKILNNNKTNILYYGGAAGGGKTYLACAWLIISCLQYKGSRWFIGRDKLKSITLSTLATFIDICNDWGLKKDEAYNINQQMGVIKFFNGSEIYLMDMHHNPTDPNFDRLGSIEFTGGFLEEVAEVARKGYEIIFSRCRYRLKEFGLIPKVLIVSNPTKNWVYTEFYRPYKEGILEDWKAFIPALATDNPHLSEEYIKSLAKLNEIDKQRLLYGNFDYDDDEAVLCDYDSICDCFSNNFVEKGAKYISSDLAMKGRDLFVVSTWDGLRCKIPLIKNKSDPREIEHDVKSQAEQNSTPRSHIVTDSDGLGSYLPDYIQGIVGFRNGSSQIDVVENRNDMDRKKPRRPFKNLKSQCAFKLAEMINQKKLFIDVPEDKQVVIGGRPRFIREVIKEELGQLKRANIDKDEQPLQIISKDEMKENLGRSPDFLDTLIMRMYFEVKPKQKLGVVSLSL